MAPQERWILVLSGGAARGFVFVGALKALQELEVPLGGIVGCSIGALVGGLYAAGIPPEEMEAVIQKMKPLDWAQLFRPTFPLQGLTDGKPVMDFLQEIVGNPSIENLNLPFASVATDLQSGEVVILHQGSLLNAIRASISIPGIFTPHLYQGRVLVDGGLIEPIPTATARKLFRDPVLAVNVLTPLPLHHAPLQAKTPPENAVKVPHLVETLVTSFYTLQRRVVGAVLEEHPPDLLLDLEEARVFGTSQFDRGVEMIQVGYDAIMRRKEAIQEARRMWFLHRVRASLRDMMP